MPSSVSSLLALFGPLLRRERRIVTVWATLLVFCCPRAVAARGSPADHLQPAVALISQGDLEGAEREAKLALNQPATRAPASVLFDFGRVCLERDLVRDATPALEKAVQLRPANDRYAYVLASAYVGKVRYKDALAILERLVKKKPEDPILNYAFGSVLYLEGEDLARAETYLRKSIRLQPDQLAAYYYLGMVVFKKGDEDQADRSFQELLQRYPNHIPSLEQLGMILVKQKKYEEAARVLDKVLELDPKSPKGHYQYSLLLARLGKREESAEHMKISRELEDERRKASKTEFYLLNPHCGVELNP